MNGTSGQPEPQWVDNAISLLLRGGVITSIAIVLLGLTLTFVHHPQYVSSREALDALTDPGATYPHTMHVVLKEAEARRGQAIVMVGLLLLIATPVARVAFSVVVFVIERDHIYVAITILVLVLLLTSFTVGAAG